MYTSNLSLQSTVRDLRVLTQPPKEKKTVIDDEITTTVLLSVTVAEEDKTRTGSYSAEPQQLSYRFRFVDDDKTGIKPEPAW